MRLRKNLIDLYCVIADTSSNVPTVNTSSDSLQSLASLQSVNGSWHLSDELAGVVQLSTSVITAAQPSDLTTSSASSLWATAVSLAFLLIKCTDKQAAFSLMERKARHWMTKQDQSSTKLVADLIEKAKKLFQ